MRRRRGAKQRGTDEGDRRRGAVERQRRTVDESCSGDLDGCTRRRQSGSGGYGNQPENDRRPATARTRGTAALGTAAGY